MFFNLVLCVDIYRNTTDHTALLVDLEIANIIVLHSIAEINKGAGAAV